MASLQKGFKMKRNVIVIGANADIGTQICEYYLKDGFNVLGTYRLSSKNIEKLSRLNGFESFKCDVTKTEDINELNNYVRERNIPWTIFISSVGTSEPIGRFFSLPFDEWEYSIKVNCLGQLHVLHSLYEHRAKDSISTVIFLAGGGTNNPFTCYSAYCVSKIFLIKMCELLDDENHDLNIFIVGPGFVRTKTHFETLKAGERAGDNYERVKKFMESGEVGTPFEKIYSCIRWLESKGRDVAGGRNISVTYDKWGHDELAKELSNDINMYKLRRYRNDW